MRVFAFAKNGAIFPTLVLGRALEVMIGGERTTARASPARRARSRLTTSPSAATLRGGQRSCSQPQKMSLPDEVDVVLHVDLSGRFLTGA